MRPLYVPLEMGGHDEVGEHVLDAEFAGRLSRD